jgi:beta-hydroxylase
MRFLGGILLVFSILWILLFIFVQMDGYTIAQFINILFSFHENPAYIETNGKWCQELRRQHNVICKEYIDYIQTHPLQRYGDLDTIQKLLDTTTIPWNVIILRMYNKNTEKIHDFPRTYEFIKRIPGCTLAMFSILPPGKVLRPHYGVYKGVYRYHLALIVPKNRDNCFLEVNGQRYHWEVGKDVLFDDTFNHRVENNTNETRVVLFLDIKKKFNHLFLDALNDFLFYFSEYNVTVIKMVDKQI